MSRKKRIDQSADEADRLPLFAAEIRGEGEPDYSPKAENKQIGEEEAGISDRTLYLFGKAELGEEMTGAEFDELERGMRAQGLDDRAIQQQRDIYNSQRLRRRNTEAIMNAGGAPTRSRWISPNRPSIHEEPRPISSQQVWQVGHHWRFTIRLNRRRRPIRSGNRAHGVGVRRGSQRRFNSGNRSGIKQGRAASGAKTTVADDTGGILPSRERADSRRNSGRDERRAAN